MIAPVTKLTETAVQMLLALLPTRTRFEGSMKRRWTRYLWIRLGATAATLTLLFLVDMSSDIRTRSLLLACLAGILVMLVFDAAFIAPVLQRPTRKTVRATFLAAGGAVLIIFSLLSLPGATFLVPFSAGLTLASGYSVMRPFSTRDV